MSRPSKAEALEQLRQRLILIFGEGSQAMIDEHIDKHLANKAKITLMDLNRIETSLKLAFHQTKGRTLPLLLRSGNATPFSRRWARREHLQDSIKLPTLNQSCSMSPGRVQVYSMTASQSPLRSSINASPTRKLIDKRYRLNDEELLAEVQYANYTKLDYELFVKEQEQRKRHANEVRQRLNSVLSTQVQERQKQKLAALQEKEEDKVRVEQMTLSYLQEQSAKQKRKKDAAANMRVWLANKLAEKAIEL